MDILLLKKLNEYRRQRKAAIIVTHMNSGIKQLYCAEDEVTDPVLDSELKKRFLSGKSGLYGDFFLAVHVPPPRLLLIGAVHISQYLIGPAKAAGFEILIIDPREAFANPSRFPGVELLAEWPEDVSDKMALDAYTAFAALSHDPKIDDFPLTEALKKNCFYVGALGSRKTHGKRLERLRQSGLDEAALARIDAPIGLDIGAASPSEIAVSILAAIIAALRGKA